MSLRGTITNKFLSHFPLLNLLYFLFFYFLAYIIFLNFSIERNGHCFVLFYKDPIINSKNVTEKWSSGLLSRLPPCWSRVNAENPLGPSSMYPRVAIVALVVDDVVSSSYTFTFVLLRLSVLLVLGVLRLLLPQ